MRLASWLGAGGVTAVAALMLIAPVTSGTALFNFTAPYVHMSKSMGNSVSTYGCAASASEPVLPAFSQHSGKFVTEASTAVGSCAASTYNYASVYASVSLEGPSFKIGSQGGHKVMVTLSTAYSAKLAVHGHSFYNNTSYSFVYAAVGLSAYFYVFDETSNTYLFGTGTYYATLASWFLTSTGSISVSSGPAVTQLWQNVQLQPGHTYETYIFLYTNVYADEYQFGGSFHNSASASLNLATMGNALYLDRITVF
ncbi:MAG: hypothetical protein L3K13_05135 [Thermoplasmata archaeon]|nr:hypothetical protein [Thermoplasmata archaeon]